jgi:hypothetical protein
LPLLNKTLKLKRLIKCIAVLVAYSYSYSGLELSTLVYVYFLDNLYFKYMSRPSIKDKLMPTLQELRDEEIKALLEVNLDALKVMSEVLDRVIKSQEELYGKY